MYRNDPIQRQILIDELALKMAITKEQIANEQIINKPGLAALDSDSD